MSSGILRRSKRSIVNSCPEQRDRSGEALGVVPVRYFRWKQAIEFPIAVILVVVALPVIGLLLVLIRLTSPGPGFYRQSRVGRDGKPFLIIKLRSMRHDAEAGTGPIWSTYNDPRVTTLGRFMRRLHLDELPQLFNVLRGEMSLVGPRPERPEIVHVLATSIPGYLCRLAVRPGITGLAQVNLPPDADIASVRRKLVLDLEYVKRAGPWLDARLLLCTAARLLKVPIVRLLGVHRNVDPPAPAPREAGPSGPARKLAGQDLSDGANHVHSPSSDRLTPSRAANGAVVGAAVPRVRPR